MPYKAAKAVAATFCYKIRHALTPIFGKDFPSICLIPTDPGYGKFLIDPAIVQECTDDVRKWRKGGLPNKAPGAEERSVMRSPPVPSTPITPSMKFACPSWSIKSSRGQHPKPVDQESGYGTDEDLHEKYLITPEVSPRNQTWTSVNRSLSPMSNTATRALTPPQRWLTSVPGGFDHSQLRTKRTLSKVAYSDYMEEERPLTAASTVDADIDTGSEAEGEDNHHTRKEIDVAQILLGMSAADTVLHRTKRTRRGPKH